jgi:tripartite-type tricarboxylate transporter receptor subunit TctC
LALAVLAGTVAIAGAAQGADCPEGFPSGPVSFDVGFGAGGGTDAIARGVATAIEAQQGWTIVVDNKPGVGGGVMAAGLKAVAPDGLTIGVAGTDTVAIGPYLSDDTQFTWEDFDYLGSAIQINYGLVTIASAPYDTLEEFVEYARENGRATISTGGTSQDVLVKQLSQHFNVEFVAVPGQGAADALQSALGGHVDATTQGTQHVQQVLSGNMKQLSTLIDKRADFAPDVKTLTESGLEESVAINAYTIFMLPKGVDAAIRICLAGAVDEAVNSESYGELMTNFDNKPANVGPEALTEMLGRDAANYQKVLGEL